MGLIFKNLFIRKKEEIRHICDYVTASWGFWDRCWQRQPWVTHLKLSPHDLWSCSRNCRVCRNSHGLIKNIQDAKRCQDDFSYWRTCNFVAFLYSVNYQTSVVRLKTYLLPTWWWSCCFLSIHHYNYKLIIWFLMELKWWVF